jgi:excisionase family DNA binding protein
MNTISSKVEQRTYTVAQLQIALAISRNLAYKLLARGEIASIRVSPRVIRIPVEAVDAYIAAKATHEE